MNSKETMKKIEDDMIKSIIQEESNIYLVGNKDRGIGKSHLIVGLAVKYGLPIYNGAKIRSLY